MLDRRFFLLLAASGAVASSPAHADAAAEVRQAITDLYVALGVAMRSGKRTPFQQRFDALAPVIDRVFDLDTILRVSVGLRWSSLEDATRSRLVTAFRRFTVASYVVSFDSFDGERLEILPATKASGTDQIVLSRLISSSDEPIKLDYLMRSGAGGWKIVDVLLDGTISRVAVQRSDFRALLAKGDGTALVESLDRKLADLVGGKPGG